MLNFVQTKEEKSNKLSKLDTKKFGKNWIFTGVHVDITRIPQAKTAEKINENTTKISQLKGKLPSLISMITTMKPSLKLSKKCEA